MHRPANPSPGFTLVELMVALVVLAILVALAVPSFTDFFERGRVRNAAEDLVSLVSNARAEAVKHDLDVSIAMKGSGTNWCAGGNGAVAPTGGVPAATADTCNCTDTAQCLIDGNRYAVEPGAHPDITIGALPADMVFDSNMGVLVPLGDRQITLTSRSGKYDVRVQINALGQAMACTPPGKPTMSSLPSCS